jgi:hypothetical protein
VKSTDRHPKANPQMTRDDGAVILEVPRTDGTHAWVVIDPEDADMIAAYHWRAVMHGGEHHWYARAGGGSRGGRVYMHRLLCEGRLVDHINGDTLDNRRANLRPATSIQNNANKRSIGGTSKYKGVHRVDSLSNPWAASIGVNNKHVRLGRFPTEEEAARAYDGRAVELWGEYACLNFPGPGQRGAVTESADALLVKGSAA